MNVDKIIMVDKFINVWFIIFLSYSSLFMNRENMIEKLWMVDKIIMVDKFINCWGDSWIEKNMIYESPQQFINLSIRFKSIFKFKKKN